MAEIKVAIIEDDKDWREIAQEYLQDIGFDVIAVAKNMVEATEDLIPRLAALGVNYVLLDGNLSPGEHSGYEGRSLAAQIRKNAPSVKIVGFSAVDQDYVDIPLGKGNIHKNLRAVFLGE